MAAIVLPLALLFPEGGFEPFPLLPVRRDGRSSRWRSCGRCPPGQRLLRVGGLVYLAACALCLAVRTPMGSNIERYGVLLAGPLLACALSAGGSAQRRRPTTAAGVLALCAIAVWVAWGPVRETLAVAGNESTERLLLRAGRALPGACRGGALAAGARRGAADALALGGGAARAERVAGARLGEAAGQPLRSTCCSNAGLSAAGL